MIVRCVHCSLEKDIPRRATNVRVLYKCHRCRKPITSVSVFSWRDWIEKYADQMEQERVAGQIGTRKQSLNVCERDISAVGIAAELAACVILAPWKVSEWMKRTASNA